jgi:F-type H+-transporting ATPase subunit gamma
MGGRGVTDRLTDIQSRVHSVRQLGTVVGVMRSIAAARAQQSRSLLPAIDTYSQMVGEAIAQALSLDSRDEPAIRPAGTAGLVVFGAEQGFAGSYSDLVLTAAQREADGAALFLVGSRAARQAGERGLRLAWHAPMAAHAAGITALAATVAEALYGSMKQLGMGRVDTIFPIWQPGAELRIERRSLLPLDPRRFRVRTPGQGPLLTLPPALLLERLAEEYVTAQLCEAASHAFAAENEARAAAMMRARDNVAGMLEALQADERRTRQEAITEEVVELARSGMRA